jgi:hypothetical protein
LDGIALALELAAARTRTVPLERLGAGWTTPSGFSRAVRARRCHVNRRCSRRRVECRSARQQRTSAAATLAVFRGQFVLQAAEAVAADGETVTAHAVLDLMGRPVDKSLMLLDDDNGHYRLLGTIRQFGLDRLREAGELALTYERHASWFADWRESLGRGDHDFDIGPADRSFPTCSPLSTGPMRWHPLTPIASAGASPASARCWGVSPISTASTHACPDGDDPAAWAAAVAGLGHLALTLARTDFPDLVARAEAVVDPADTGTRCFLRLFGASVSCPLGDRTEAAELITLAERRR